MAQTLYASFPDASLAEKAAGALMDFGVQPEEISLVSRGGSMTAMDLDVDTREETVRRDYTAHSATLAERSAGYGGAATMDHDNDALNAGGSAWDTGKAMGNKVAEGGDRMAAGIADAFGNDRAEAKYEAAADERNDRADERWSQAKGEAADAVDLDKTSGRYDDPVSTASHGDHDYGRSSAEYPSSAPGGSARMMEDEEVAAKYGISTTTPGDAAAGAAKGATIGLGVGALAALSALMIPGIGLVIGGGALATALAGAAGATAAGAVAGGVHGYLKDQGVPDHVAMDYNQTVQSGGAILAVQMREGDVTETEVREILTKYGASNVGTYGLGMAA